MDSAGKDLRRQGLRSDQQMNGKVKGERRMFNVGPWELLLVLGIALIIFGPGKLPKLGESLGKAITGFKKAQAGEEDEVKAVK